MDRITPEQRRKSMRGNKSQGTKIEVALGKALFAKGLRYRKNNKLVFGTPDFTFKKYKIAIFADGDFWHGKDWETRRNKIGHNAAYWFEKIERNLERDYKVNKKLKEDGWIVLRFWESDIRKNTEKISDFVYKVFQQQKALRENQKVAFKKKTINKFLRNKEFSTAYTKTKAIDYTIDLLKEKYPDETLSLNVAEEILKYGISDD